MTNHVYLRLTGFGATVTPYAPFRIVRLDAEGRRLRVASEVGEAVFDFALTVPDSVPHIADVSKSAFQNPWRLETAVYSSPWPQTFEIVSTQDPASPAGYDLIGPQGSLIYVQGPFPPSRLASVHSLVAAGQTVRSVGQTGAHEWIRLAYEHEGNGWEQTHVLVRLAEFSLAVTTQAPLAHADDTFAAACAMAMGVLPFRLE